MELNEKIEEIFEFTSDDIKIKDYFPEIYEEILLVVDKADKYNKLMTHTKYHNMFGCAYHFKLKESDRRNQFLQSDNVKLEASLQKQTDNVFDLLSTGLDYKSNHDKLLVKINNRIKQLQIQIDRGECDILERVNIGELLKSELESMLK